MCLGMFCSCVRGHLCVSFCGWGRCACGYTGEGRVCVCVCVSVCVCVCEYLGAELDLEPLDKVFTVYRSPATIAKDRKSVV